MADNEYITIKEFSLHTGITASTLRHYDKIGLIVPAIRSVNGKYRLYSPLQITSAKTIRMLAQINTPLKTIKKLEKRRSPRQLTHVLDTSMNVVTDEISRLCGLRSVIDVTKELLNEANVAIETELCVLDMPEKKILMGNKNNYSNTTGFVREYTRFCNRFQERSRTPSYPVGGYFDSMEIFLSRPSQPCRFFFLDPNGDDCKDAGQYLVGYTRGYYGETNDLPLRMATYAEKNGLEFAGPVYNTYLTTELSERNSSKCLLQVAVPVKKTWRPLFRHLKYQQSIIKKQNPKI